MGRVADISADDLPLNVSRETLQNHRFLSQLQRILVRKAIDLFTKLAKDEPEQYQEVSKLYGNALRIGMLESKKDHIKIAKLLRFESTRSGFTSLEEVCILLFYSSFKVSLIRADPAVCGEPQRRPEADLLHCRCGRDGVGAVALTFCRKAQGERLRGAAA